jgi:hypothetical protein
MSDGAFCHYCKRADCECPEPTIGDKGVVQAIKDYTNNSNWDTPGCEGRLLDVACKLADAFIAEHEPNGDMAVLLAEVDRLTAENTAMKSMLQSCRLTVVNGKWARTEETV